MPYKQSIISPDDIIRPVVKCLDTDMVY